MAFGTPHTHPRTGVEPMSRLNASLAALVVAALTIVFAAAPALADQVSQQEMDQRLAAAQRYLGLTTDVSAMVDRMVGDVSKRMQPEQAKKFKETFARFATKERVQSITERMAKAMAATFTVKEINALAEFYGSPVGKAIAQKMPEYATKSSLILSQEIVEFAKQERARMQQEEEEKKNQKQ